MSVFFPELNENNKTCSKTYAFYREKSLEKLWSRMEDQSNNVLHIQWAPLHGITDVINQIIK
jgi:hypothetical protein